MAIQDSINVTVTVANSNASVSTPGSENATVQIPGLVGPVGPVGPSSTGDISVLSGNLIATGSYLDLRIISQSGFSLNSFNSLSGSLVNSGVQLQNSLNTTNNNVIATGDYLSLKLNNLSGLLGITGNTLQREIDSLSGIVLNKVNAADTGNFVSIYKDITGIQVTGSSSILAGLVNFTVAGGSQVIMSGNSIIFSGGAGGGGGTVQNGANVGPDTGIFKQLNGSNLEFKTIHPDLGIFISGDANILLLQATGLVLNTDANKTGLLITNTFSSLSGSLNNSGIQLQNTTNSLSGLFNNTISSFSGSLDLSGVNIQNRLISSGNYVDSKINNFSGVVSTGLILIHITGSSGVLYGNQIFTGTSTINIISTTGTSGINLVIFSGDTGINSNIFNTINSLSGQSVNSNSTGNFVTVDRTGAYVTNNLTGRFVTSDLTGNNTQNSSTGNFANIFNLQTTGFNLSNYINSLSGNFMTTGIGLFTQNQYLSGLLFTGFNLTKVTGMSGVLTGIINYIGTGNVSLILTTGVDQKPTLYISGNTGAYQNFQNAISSLSGLIYTNDITGIQTTGASSTLVGLIQLTSAGGNQLFQSGNSIVISGVNDLSNALNSLSGSLVSNTIGARVYNSTGTTSANGAEAAIVWDSKNYDTNAMFSIANPTRLTCNTSGIYVIQGEADLAASALGTQRQLRVRLNGSTFIAQESQLSISATTTSKLGINTVYNLNNTDYIELMALQDAATLAINSGIDRTWFSASLQGTKVSNVTTLQVTGSQPLTGLFNLTSAGGTMLFLSGQNIVISGGSAGGGAGTITTALNIGNGVGLFSGVSGSTLDFKTLGAIAPLNISGDTQLINFQITGALTEFDNAIVNQQQLIIQPAFNSYAPTSRLNGQGTGYWVYMGRATKSFTPSYISAYLVNAASAVNQTGELGIFTSPGPPNKSGQMLTKLFSSSSITVLSTAGGAIFVRNLAAFTSGIVAGQYIWAGMRTAMNVAPANQGSFLGMGATAATSDNGLGYLLATSTCSGSTGTFDATNQISGWPMSVVGVTLTIPPILRIELI